MKATENYFPEQLGLNVLSLWMKSGIVTIELKAANQFFCAVLFVTLYKMALIFECVDEIPKCDYSNESYWAVLSCGAVCYTVQDGFNF